MLQSRIIPCLLLHKGGLVKTVKFKKPRYVGDPINAVRIFNEKEVDELIVIDIDATVEKREPKYDQIEDIVSEAYMPVCYGGGVTSVEQMQKLFYLGIEKVSISQAALNTPDLVTQAATQFGSQSIIVTIDVKRSFFRQKYQVVTLNSKKNTGENPIAVAKRMASLGAGELVISNVDRDGVMEGYDLELVNEISKVVDVPIVALGGAGSLDDFHSVVKKGGASAAAAGSMFVYQGVHRAVLINYPPQTKLRELFQD